MRFIRSFLMIFGVAPSLCFAQMAQVPAFDNTASPFKVVFGLLIVLGVIAAFAWLMKRFNHSKIGGHSVAKIVGGVNLGSRERLVVIELAGHWIVAGVTPGNINSLGSFKISESTISNISPAAIALDDNLNLTNSDELEKVTNSTKSAIKDRFRFESHPVAKETQSVDRLEAMANPALTEIFKRLLKK